MAKVWKIVSTVAGIALLLGVVCVLVGVITGGDVSRVLSLFNARFDIAGLKDKIDILIHSIMGVQPLA